MRPSVRGVLPLLLLAGALGIPSGIASGAAAAPIRSGIHGRVGAIPAFSRMYQTGCSTCHTAAPKLNVLGEVFRLNGYRLPESELLIRKDEPVPLGAEPWKEVWPRAIWPGSVPGQVPLAFRIQSDVRVTRDERPEYSWTYRLPHELYLLAGAPLGEDIGAFVEAEWSRRAGLQVVQAKVAFQDPLPPLPDRALNLWVGLQNLYLFTFTDRQIDRAARQQFSWQSFSVSELLLRDPASGEELRAANQLRLGGTQPAVELNGILGRRLYYGIGIAQGGSIAEEDANNHKDIYYKLRYKLGGLDLTGAYDRGGGPVPGGGGQLLDRAVIVEHFGYFGDESTRETLGGGHRSLGANVRALAGPLDLGAGYVWRRFDRPWELGSGEGVTSGSLFGKLEYLPFPWVIASLKADRLRVRLPAALADRGIQVEGTEQFRVLPGAILLVRQNVRAVVEGELFLRDQVTDLHGLPRPHNLWLRLDLSF